MTALFLLELAALGFVGAFVTGLLGVGGAIVMIPLLLYVPPFLGIGSLGIKTVAAVTMVQVFAASLSGVLAHGRQQTVDRELALFGGLSMALASLIGAVSSKFVGERVLLGVFAVMATLAAPLMLLPVREPRSRVPGKDERVNRPAAAGLSAVVGFMAGLVGVGGAFLLVPILIFALGVSTHTAIGSSLAMTAISAFAGFIGKLATGQIPLAPSVAVVVGALPGAQVGAQLSRRIEAGLLRTLLAAIIILTAVRVWHDFLSR
mgnify:CR=1 FL=1|jgi:uncharacterized membrane protein YfcA